MNAYRSGRVVSQIIAVKNVLIQSMAGGISVLKCILVLLGLLRTPQGTERKKGSRMYAWSFDMDMFFNGEFDTFEEALADARLAARTAKEQEGEDFIAVYIGQTEKYMPDISVFDVIERISDDCYDLTCYETYLTDLTDEEETSLLTALRGAFLKWANKHGYKPSDIWSVKSSTIEKVIL